MESEILKWTLLIQLGIAYGVLHIGYTIFLGKYPNKLLETSTESNILLTRNSQTIQAPS